MLNIRADHAGRVLRAKRERLRLLTGGAGAILPGVHLLGNDVSLLPHAAGEELGGLEDRRTDFAKAVAGEDGAGGRLDAVPESGFRREKIAGAANGFQRGHKLPVYRTCLVNTEVSHSSAGEHFKRGSLHFRPTPLKLYIPCGNLTVILGTA